MTMRTLGTYTPSGSEVLPASLPVPPGGACCAMTFTVRQNNKTNNKDLANVMILLFTQETFSGITPGISGERPFNVHERNAEARVRCMPLLGVAAPQHSIRLL